MRIQIIAIHGGVLAVRRVADRSQHGGGHRRRQWFSRARRRRMGAKSGAVDRVRRATCPIRQGRICTRRATLLNEKLSSQLRRTAEPDRHRLASPGYNPPMRAMHLFQILTPHVAREDLDPGFSVLDNCANPRPDWFEYWPIRNFLLTERLE